MASFRFHKQAITQPVPKLSEAAARKGDENGRLEEKAEADEEGHLERRRNHDGEWSETGIGRECGQRDRHARERTGRWTAK